MPNGAPDTAAVLDRLDQVLPDRAPQLWQSRRPPASPADLDALRRAVDPYEVPDEVLALLRWANGQQGNSPSWPSVDCGPLLSATQAAEHYSWLRDETEIWQWNPLWLPVTHEGWYQAGVEMTSDHPGAVIDGSFPDPEVRVVAPSLAAMLELPAAMLEAGVAITPPQDPAGYRRWRDERQALIDGHDDWRAWPYDRVIASNVDGWPPHWRVAIGLPAATDLPHPAATGIRTLIAGDPSLPEPVTIEGYVTERVLVDSHASGNSIITLDDGTGTLRVLVQPDTPGQYWAAWTGRRIQIDLLHGPDAQRSVDAILDGDPQRRTRAPDGECTLAVEVRMGAQLNR
jgi:hypothetical protein